MRNITISVTAEAENGDPRDLAAKAVEVLRTSGLSDLQSVRADILLGEYDRRRRAILVSADVEGTAEFAQVLGRRAAKQINERVSGLIKIESTIAATGRF